MKSQADSDTRLDQELNGARDTASWHTVAALLILTGGGNFIVEGLGARRAEATPLTAVVDVLQVSASATHPAAASPRTTPAVSAPHATAAAASPPDARAAVASAGDRTAQLPLPNNASDELRSLARGAVAGQANAEHDLGTFFALGIEVPQNLERAAYWYRRAADQGVASAAYNLGVLLERGLGVPRDPEAAVARFRQAAEAGHAGALNALGIAYLSGSGVTRDPMEALIWFRRASIGGNPRGAYNVAKLYEDGELGAPDPQTAASWYRVAADAGSEPARAALARLQALASGDGVPRIGFVSLAPEAGLLVLDQISMPAAAPDPILDSLAAQMADSPPLGPAKVAMAPASAAPPAAGPVRVTVAQIREIQQLLTRVNLDVGPIDGVVGRRTRAAIARFQQSQDLPVTRRPSVELLSRLRAATTLASRD
ncbi:MAG: peptidoglycan-binding protein [Inquilinus sp.]|uniref:peptidoglycan-binding protein n=1 Tax=Inquilinus sp. TaxID=1932117 RepID=UPI003F3CF4FF